MARDWSAEAKVLSDRADQAHQRRLEAYLKLFGKSGGQDSLTDAYIAACNEFEAAKKAMQDHVDEFIKSG